MLVYADGVDFMLQLKQVARVAPCHLQPVICKSVTIMPGRIDFLKQLDLFSELTENEIIDLARIAKEYEFEDGAVIAYQRDVAHSMYIVREGRLYSQRLDKSGAVRESKAYTENQYFGEEWLFAPSTHPATIKGHGNGRVIIIDGQEFLRYLSAHLEVLDALEPFYDEITGEQVAGLSPKAWEEARKYRDREVPGRTAVNLLPDEIVEFATRGSVRWLILTEIIPVAGIFLIVPFVYAFFTDTTLDFLALPITILLFIFFIIYSLLEVVDWLVDYLIITNKHVIRREFELTRMRIKNSQVPINQVQSVRTLKPDLISNILGVGTIRVTTASPVGTISFDHIDNPIQVEKSINRLTARVRTVSEAESQTAMRKSLEDYFEQPPAYRQLSVDDEEIPIIPDEPAPPGYLSALLNRYRWRVVDGDVTTYRKHVFVLLRELFPPIGMGLFTAAIWVVASQFLVGISSLIMGLVFGTIYFVLFLWGLWQAEDWRNDTFQVTSRFVIDIDRKPFGFAESRKQAPLARIQNVSAERPGLFPTLFNYGYVQVETAGAVADIRFENVARPSEIQSDIFRRLDEYQQQLRHSEGLQRRKEYAVLMDVYKQATEQARIPRRTPDQEEEVVMVADEGDPATL
jgi:uncharacterized membrane protein YdbT with pleckstrin-like domain